jgi:hypothetical protein
MPRLLDWDCSNSDCGFQVRDEFVMEIPDARECPQCHMAMERAYYVSRRQHASQWSDRDAVVVFKDANGRVSYPARNDKATPAGYERIVIRSLPEMNKFEREHKVVNEAMHFNRNGRGMDDTFRGKEFSH